jgi:hypothetical protein
MLRSVLALSLGATLHPASAALMEFSPTRDTSIYSDAPSFSNGAGDFLFAGATNNGTDYLRRALLAFDFSAIPAGSVVVSAELRLTVSRKPLTDSGLRTFTLHRVTSDWGEGTSDASGEEGSGIAAASGDATWINRLHSPAQGWTTAGGDFAATASAVLEMGDPAPYLFNLPGITADVQAWVNGAPNRGWALLGDETRDATARRFNSRNDPDTGPLLTVEYQLVPEPSAAVLTGFGLVFLVLRRNFPAA